jgi:cell division protease FtsH
MIVVVVYMVVAAAMKAPAKPQKPDYTTYMQKVEANQVESVKVQGEITRGVFKDGGDFEVRVPGDPKIYESILRTHNVKVEFLPPSRSDMWTSTLVSIGLMGLFVLAFWFLVMRQAQGSGNQALAFGRSRARLAEGAPKVTFDDVAGVEEAKQELMEVVEFLKHPKKFQALGARIPRGVLLQGPPGCGKTLLARAVAGEAGVPFYHISGSDFVEMFVGVGASRVRDLFAQAKQNPPCIIFIDELDAVGRQRFAGVGGGHDEREQTLNQLLVEMDGFDPNIGVILMSATNRPDVLDPALLRPGRFDRRITVDNPDLQGRLGILKVHVRGKPLGPDVDIELLARRTPGFSGADLANLMNEAALLAARRSKTQIEQIDFDDSIDRVVAGPERRSRIISDKERLIVANHEVGHAMAAELLPDADPVHKLSILPRGVALGYTMHAPLTDKYLFTRTELLANITVLLGGRAAEHMLLGEATTGEQSDLDRATDIARRMVTEFGMSDRLGPITLGRRHDQTFLGRDLLEDRNYSEQIANVIDEELKAIIDECSARATTLLTENREGMDAIVKLLLEKETLDREQMRAVLREYNAPLRED